MLKNKHIKRILLISFLLLGILSISTSTAILNTNFSHNSTDVLAADTSIDSSINEANRDPLTMAKDTFITVKGYDQKVEDSFVDWVSDIKSQINKILQ